MKKNRYLYSTLLALTFPIALNAAGSCPVPGLDKKICPNVVSFFDEMAKHDTEFAKHWQNHQWVQQAGDNYVPKITIKEHAHLSFRDDNKREDLATFINNAFSRAISKNPDFQKVLDSHNFFVMTVQAMHLYLQEGANYFNKSGSPMISLDGKVEESDLTLEYRYDIQVPETDPYLVSRGITTNTLHRYVPFTKIDSTTYLANTKVNPVIVKPTIPVSASPKTPKVVIANHQKLVQGASNIPSTTSKVTQVSPNTFVINKKPASKTRQGNQLNNVPTPSPQAPVIAPNKVPNPTPNMVPNIVNSYNVPKPMKSAGKTTNQKLVQSKYVNYNRPNKIAYHKAEKGTNKNNINTRFIKTKPGSHIDHNERHYVIDDNMNVWSCKISGLGFRFTKDSNGNIQSLGHVETTHIKSAQLAHIPTNYSFSNNCLLSINK